MENENTDFEQSQIEETVESTDVETQDDSNTDDDSVDYKALYEETSSKYKKLKRKLFTKEQPSQPIINAPDTKWKERMELKVDGYDDEAITFIQKNGGKKALENPYIVKAIEAIKEQRIAEKATVEAGTKSQTEKRFSPQEFSKLPHEEQLKVLSELN